MNFLVRPKKTETPDSTGEQSLAVVARLDHGANLSWVTENSVKHLWGHVVLYRVFYLSQQPAYK